MHRLSAEANEMERIRNARRTLVQAARDAGGSTARLLAEDCAGAVRRSPSGAKRRRASTSAVP
jgi:hypothetical protein